MAKYYLVLIFFPMHNQKSIKSSFKTLYTFFKYLPRSYISIIPIFFRNLTVGNYFYNTAIYLSVTEINFIFSIMIPFHINFIHSYQLSKFWKKNKIYLFQTQFLNFASFQSLLDNSNNLSIIQIQVLHHSFAKSHLINFSDINLDYYRGFSQSEVSISRSLSLPLSIF